MGSMRIMAGGATTVAVSGLHPTSAWRRRGAGLAGPHANRGVVLVIALIFLLLLTILAISSSGRSLLQERMAGNLRNAQQAQMAAENALRAGEWRLWMSTASFSTAIHCVASSDKTTTDNCWVYGPEGAGTAVTEFRTESGWLDGYGAEYKGPDGATGYQSYSGDMKTAMLAENPRYMIEDMGVELPPGVGRQHESGSTSSVGTGYENVSRHIYRITARATGASPNTVRVVESTFAAKTN